MSILYVCHFDGNFEISYRGAGLSGPLFKIKNPDYKARNALKRWNNEIDLISKKYKTSAVRINTVALSIEINHFLRHNWLLEFGYHDCSFSTRIIDLSLSKEQLYAQFDRTTKYDINKISLEIEIAIVNYENYMISDLNDYISIHLDASGRRTRSMKTFEIMGDLILDGNAILIFACIRSKRISVTYVPYFNGRAYYGSSATLKEFDRKRGVTESMQLQIINYLKFIGIKTYEMGYQFYLEDIKRLGITKKDIDISKYKRRFGGFTTPIFSGKKFFSL
jgi:hypothetical protein